LILGITVLLARQVDLQQRLARGIAKTMKEKRLTKKFPEVLLTSKGFAHAVKKMLTAKGLRGVKNVETYCGRNRMTNGPEGAIVSADVVTCQSCIKAMAAAGKGD